MIRTLIRATTMKINSSPPGMAALHHGMRCARTQANHDTQRRHQPEQHAAPPRCGKPFQPAKIIDRGLPGLRCRHVEGRDLFEVLIKKRSSAITDDAHRVREAIRRIGVVQQLLVDVATAYKMRDEIRQPRDRNGSKNYAGRSHTQTVRGEPRSSGDLERCVARNGCDGCCKRRRDPLENAMEFDRDHCADDLVRLITAGGGSPIAARVPPEPPRRSVRRPGDRASRHRCADSEGGGPRAGSRAWPPREGSSCSRV